MSARFVRMPHHRSHRSTHDPVATARWELDGKGLYGTSEDAKSGDNDEWAVRADHDAE